MKDEQNYKITSDGIKNAAENWKRKPLINHLSWTESERIDEMLRDAEIANKLDEGYYAERLIWIAALPKSSSRGIENLFKTMQAHSKQQHKAFLSLHPEQGRHYSRAGLRSDPDINYMLQNVMNGGVYRKHFAPNAYNLKLLDELQCRYAITVRHPIDYIVAAYCHNNIKLEFRDPHANMGVGSLDDRKFEFGHDIDEVLCHLIEDGHLFDALSWITKWLHHRNEEMSVVVRYEDVINKDAQESEFKRISNHIFTCDLDEQAVELCRNVFTSQKEQRGKSINSSKYPRGWSGKVGIWKDYLNEKHVESYNKIVSAFIDCCPSADKLLQLYPDLIAQR